MAEADVVVVGGGCTGASAAFWLASRHGQRVILLDRGQVGNGPTARTSGIVRMHYSYEPLIRLALRSLRVFTEFEEIVGGTADFRQTGFLILAPRGQESTLAANVQLQQQLGVDTALLGPEAVREIDGRLRTDDLGGAAYEHGSGYADGYATAAAFAAAARRHRASVREGAGVIRVLVDRGRVSGVETAGGIIRAGAVLVAAGPWTRALLAPLGVDLPIRATRHQVLVAETPPGEPPLRPVVVDLVTGLYSRPDVGHQFLLGTIEEHPEEEVDADAYNEGADYEFVERLSGMLVRRIPAFANVAVRTGYASLYDVTPDWQPVLGPVPGIDGLYAAAGFSGHGFKLSPAVGEALAAMIADGRFDAIDLGAFRVTRFREAVLIHSPYAQGILG